MVELKRSGTGHLAQDQTFIGVKAVNGKVVSIQLAGSSTKGDIRFAFKHILDKSSKQADDDAKLRNRVWHRVDKGGAKTDNPNPGAKVTGPGVVSRTKKYASALKYDADHTKMKNTAIYLSLMNLDTVLKEMANAFAYHNWNTDTEAHVEVEFSKPCIKTADAAGNITGPISTCKIQVYKIGNDSYVLGHLG